MDNNIFVNKLIQGTKKGALVWQRAKSHNLYNNYTPYYIQNKDKRLVLEKYNVTRFDGYGDEIEDVDYILSICDASYNSLSDIYSSDLSREGDLSRLYRLVERQFNHIDDIMEDFIKDMGDDFQS